MIRATGATWISYATTLVFQILFAARFGTAPQAAAYVVAFAAAVSLGGVFITTALTIAVPRMLDANGAISRPVARFLGGVVLSVAITALAIAAASPAQAGAAAPLLHVARGDMTLLFVIASAFLGAESIAGVLGTIALARGRRFAPAVLPTIPSALGAVYLLAGSAPTAVATLGAVAIGAAVQLLIITIVLFRPPPRLVDSASLQVGLLTLLTAGQLLLLGLIPTLQRLAAAAGDPSGPARFDYAFRGTVAAQQLLIGGLLIAILPDWAAAHRRAGNIALGVVRAWMVGGLLLTTAASIALVAAPTIIRLLFERGAFRAADTSAVALLLRILLVGFVAEGVTLVVVQGVVATAHNDLALRLGFFRLGVQVILTLLLGALLGSIGVAIAYSASLTLALFYAVRLSVPLGLFEGGRLLVLRSGSACIATGLAGAVVTIPGAMVSPLVGTLVVIAVAGLSIVGLGLRRPLLEALRQSPGAQPPGGSGT
jgi:putative peptidoglycan lipid II flippase